MFSGFSYRRTGGSNRQRRKKRTTQNKERPLPASLGRQNDTSATVSHIPGWKPQKHKPRFNNWFERLPSPVQLVLAIGIFALLLLIGMRPEAAGAITLVLSALHHFFFGGDEPPQGWEPPTKTTPLDQGDQEHE